MTHMTNTNYMVTFYWVMSVLGHYWKCVYFIEYVLNLLYNIWFDVILLNIRSLIWSQFIQSLISWTFNKFQVMCRSHVQKQKFVKSYRENWDTFLSQLSSYLITNGIWYEQEVDCAISSNCKNHYVIILIHACFFCI